MKHFSLSSRESLAAVCPQREPDRTSCLEGVYGSFRGEEKAVSSGHSAPLPAIYRLLQGSEWNTEEPEGGEDTMQAAEEAATALLHGTNVYMVVVRGNSVLT